MSDPTPEARDLLCAITGGGYCEHSDESCAVCDLDNIVEALRAAEERGRRAGLEEAATFAETKRGLVVLAEDLRALAKKGP